MFDGVCVRTDVGVCAEDGCRKACVAETKGYDKDSLKDYRRAESVKIECASRHFATISDSYVIYDVVKNYDELWDIITKP